MAKIVTLTNEYEDALFPITSNEAIMVDGKPFDDVISKTIDIAPLMELVSNDSYTEEELNLIKYYKDVLLLREDVNFKYGIYPVIRTDGFHIIYDVLDVGFDGLLIEQSSIVIITDTYEIKVEFKINYTGIAQTAFYLMDNPTVITESAKGLMSAYYSYLYGGPSIQLIRDIGIINCTSVTPLENAIIFIFDDIINNQHVSIEWNIEFDDIDPDAEIQGIVKYEPLSSVYNIEFPDTSNTADLKRFYDNVKLAIDKGLYINVKRDGVGYPDSSYSTNITFAEDNSIFIEFISNIYANPTSNDVNSTPDSIITKYSQAIKIYEDGTYETFSNTQISYNHCFVDWNDEYSVKTLYEKLKNQAIDNFIYYNDCILTSHIFDNDTLYLKFEKPKVDFTTLDGNIATDDIIYLIVQPNGSFIECSTSLDIFATKNEIVKNFRVIVLNDDIDTGLEIYRAIQNDENVIIKVNNFNHFPGNGYLTTCFKESDRVVISGNLITVPTSAMTEDGSLEAKPWKSPYAGATNVGITLSIDHTGVITYWFYSDSTNTIHITSLTGKLPEGDINGIFNTYIASLFFNLSVHTDNIDIDITSSNYTLKDDKCIVKFDIPDENDKYYLCTINKNGNYFTKEYDSIISIKNDIENIENDKADKDGYYKDMSVGFADNLVGRGEATSEEFTYRASAGNGRSIGDGVARIAKIKGNSVVWNQMAKALVGGNYYIPSAYNVEYINEGLTLTLVDSGTNSNVVLHSLTPLNFNSHKWLAIANVQSDKVVSIKGMSTNGFVPNQLCQIYAFYNSTDNRTWNWGLSIDQNDPPTRLDIKNFRVYDLTREFDAGNEPSTIEEFYARIPQGIDPYAYNEGEIVDMNVDAIKTTGFNQWDEQWESGMYNIHNGTKQASSEDQIRSINKIQVLPNTTYFFSVANEQWGWLLFYDSTDDFISASSITNRSFTTPLNAQYMRFHMNASYGSTYNHDICINLSHSGYKNGTYEPYKTFTRDISWVKKYFPNGMKSAGAVCDEIRWDSSLQKWVAVQNVGSVDLGSVNWTFSNDTIFKSTLSLPIPDLKKPLDNEIIGTCARYIYVSQTALDTTPNSISIFASGRLWINDSHYTDGASLKEALQNVWLNYELAEPDIKIIEEDDVNFDYEVNDFGTEELITSGVSSAFAGDIIYQFNATDQIRTNKLSIDELKELVLALRNEIAELKASQVTQN